MRVFLDANILFSAAQSNSRMRLLLESIQPRGQCVTNQYAIEEARRNIAAKIPSALGSLEELIKGCEVVQKFTTQLEVQLPLKDIPILGGAVAGRATHLLTGDRRDFGKLWGRTVRGVKVVTV
jgi:predicted nucleic acid-binding protein